jgi:hypothetical protein
MKYSFLISVFFILLPGLDINPAHAQEQPSVTDASSGSRFHYQFPWAGGMNSCQFGKIDINLDGIDDLVVFDRAGGRIMPFLVVQSGENYDYHYDPGFINEFPNLFHWAIFTDYDLDGKKDIFTYSPMPPGIIVYRNVSDSSLEFVQVVSPYLTSFQGGGYVNILVTYADYPAITDLDGDGDLDILTFWGLGSFVEKHRNMSMEKYGHADSLDYIKTEFCWGFFAESEESNELTLDTCLRCSGKEAWEQGGRGLRHTGSTFCILDLNGDALPDLLLGDVDYPNLVALYNGGSTDTAMMTAYDWLFPAGEKPVDLFSMPAAFYEDFDFDGIKDLLVSPFDPNPFLTSNFRSVWLYHNFGSDDNPQLGFHSSSFLQNRMIDLGAGAYPALFDIDNDGLMDLLAGNYGYYDSSYFDESLILHTEQTGKLAYFRNTGTQEAPSFDFTSRDFAGASSLGLVGIVPAFSDLDGDGDADMILGSETGQLALFLNKGGVGAPLDLEFELPNFPGIDVGAYSAPQLFDLDKDNLDDLIIGEKAGNINYYRNTGTNDNPNFTYITDSLGKINVTNPYVSLDGYSVPFFYRDNDGQTHLLVGSEQGEIYYFTNIDGNLAGKFIVSDTLAGLIGLQELKTDRGYRTAPVIFDFDNNGTPELLCGNFAGGLEYLGMNAKIPVSQIKSPDLNQNEKISVYPIPAKDHITVWCHDCQAVYSSEIQIYDSRGSLIYSFSGNDNEKTRIDLRLLNKGIYFLKIRLMEKNSNEIITGTFKIALMH